MSSVFGMRGDDFTLVASDATLSRSLLKLQSSADRHVAIYDKVSMAGGGDYADAHALLAFAREKVKFENLRNKVPVTARVAANVVRQSVHGSLRESGNAAACIVSDKASLFAIDAYGAMWEADYACLGYAQYFLYGILDREWTRGISLDGAMEIARKCVFALKENFVQGCANYTVRVVHSAGISESVIGAAEQ